MKGLFKYGAIASIFLLTAGSAAFAQNYSPSSGADWNQGSGWNQGSSTGWHNGSQGWNQGGMQSGGWNQNGNQGWNQGSNQGWNQGSFSGSSQGSNQSMNQGANNEPSQQDAYQELSKYGYNNVRNLQRSEGWEAHATRNGDRVHVFIDDDGMIATYRGD